MAENHDEDEDEMPNFFTTLINLLEAEAKMENVEKQTEVFSKIRPTGKSGKFKASRNRQGMKKQQMNVSAECDLISREMTAANGEVSKALDKQMLDLKKSFQEKAKFIITMQTICSQMQDSIEHAMGKESGGS